jgi:hypothetical protein
MFSVTVEEISPELVLVCPELREQALALLPKLPWERVVSRAREQASSRAAATPSVSALRESVAALLQFGQLATVVIVATILLTLALTLVADFTR